MKRLLNYDSQIVEAVLAVIRDEATTEQEELLNEWLDSSRANRDLFYTICDPISRTESIERLRSYDKSRAWFTIMAKVAQRRKRRLLMRTGQVAAAVLLLISVGTTLYLWNDQPNKREIAGQLIMPGSPKAILTFANGESVGLDTVSVGAIGSAVVANGHEIKFADVPKLTTEDVNYNIIAVPRGGEYKVTLSDGSVVYLNSQTTLRFPENFNGMTQRELFIDGEGFFDVVKNPEKPFIVHCGKFEVEAVGTTFNIANYIEDVVSRTTVASGRVKISLGTSVQEIVAGEQAVVNPSNNSLDVMIVDVDNYTSWINAKLRFEGMKISEIMQRLARWYDVEIVYANSAKLDIHFTGYLPRYANIGEVLNLLELASNVSFEVNGRVITVK